MNIRNVVRIIDHHLVAVLTGALSSHLLSNVIAEGDLADELRAVTCGQLDILTTFLEGKHYGTNNINEFIAYTEEVKRQALRLLKIKQDNNNDESEI